MSDSLRNSPIQRANKGLDSIYTKQQRPDGVMWTIHSVALLVGRSERTIYNMLSLHADRFGDPMYEKLYLGHGDQRLYRVLSEADMRVIRELWPVYVKRKRG